MKWILFCPFVLMAATSATDTYPCPPAPPTAAILEQDRMCPGGVAPGGMDGPAALPMDSMRTALAVTPSPGQVIKLPPTGDLQVAYNGAKCGDIIELDPAGTYNATNWVFTQVCDPQHYTQIRTSADDSTLPPEGTRINPSWAGVPSLPGRPAFSGSTARRGTGQITQVFDGTASSFVIFDRNWIHGTPLDESRRAFGIAGADHIAFINNYINDYHCNAGGVCNDSQTIAGGTGTAAGGVIKIDNNFLEAAAEAVLFGGGGGTATLCDIEVPATTFSSR